MVLLYEVDLLVCGFVNFFYTSYARFVSTFMPFLSFEIYVWILGCS